MNGPAVLPALALRVEPPLDPDGDEARSLLGRELARPEYYDADILDRIIDWLARLIDGSVGAAESSPPVAVAAAIVVAMLLAAGILLLITQARATARGDRAAAPALT
ncbi:hypothetical protein E7Z54_06625, partial [Nocardioides sp.]